MPNIINEYLYSIGAYYDSKSFKNAQNQVNKQIDKIVKKWKEYYEAVKDGDKDKQEEMLKNMNGFEKAFGKSMSSMVVTAGELNAAFQPLLITLDATKDSLELIYELSTKVSNQFVDMQSLFVDKDVRNLMAMTGVGTVEAQAIRTAEDLTGMGIEELPYATPQQQKMFQEFIDTYTKGINELDAGDLETFNDATQQFQKTIAESKLKLQLTFMKTIIATGPQLESLFNTITDTIEDFNSIATSDAFQTGAKLFVSTIKGIVDVLTLPIDVAGGIADYFSKPEGSNQGNTTNNNVTINSNAQFQGNPNQQVGIAQNYSRNNALYIAQSVGNVVK